MEVSANRRGVVHFPNLNGLRFFAAFVVMVHHIEQYRYMYKLKNYWSIPMIARIGEQGVTLFFVLSGFLITYLLLTEKEHFGFINKKLFYVRRMLRIWPLYFTVVILAFLILPHINFFNIVEWSNATFYNLKKKLFLFIIVTPNLALSLYGVVPYLAQSWSIGTEEQFYLFWPWVVQKSKKPLLIFVLMCILYISFKYSVNFVANGYGTNNLFIRLLSNFLYWFRIESMFIGSIVAAILFFKHDRLLRSLTSTTTQVIVLLLLAIIITWGHVFPFYAEIYSILFSLLILSLASASHPIVNLDNRLLNFLGRISYGLYMLQSIAIIAVIKIFSLPIFKDIPVNFVHLLTIIFSFVILVLIATISYYGLEKPFLKLKAGFMLIKSSN